MSEQDAAVEPLTFNSPEFQAAYRRGDRAQIAEWMRTGRYNPSPLNPYAAQVAGAKGSDLPSIVRQAVADELDRRAGR